ncbi:MAG: HypC/HybG/HupF family hydrogenase formation chaperone [Bacteroidetes bacterium]|nr:HypC/HybG/HupF family hydrogenase formation chaperone [Bacteroidota bacterium]
MCLGVPGRVIRIDESRPGMTMGMVDFGGVSKEVCLAYVPEAKVGDYVVVHVGFAISVIDREEAMHVFELLRQAGEAGEGEDSQER